MAALPNYVKVLFNGAGEKPDPGVEVFETERGLDKLRVVNSRAVIEVTVVLRTYTRADANAFDTWYHDTINRIGFFDWLDPRTRTIRSVRFKRGELGEMTPRRGSYEIADRSATLEYLR